MSLIGPTLGRFSRLPEPGLSWMALHFVKRMERDGEAGSYLSMFKKVLNSWLSYMALT